MNKNTNLNTLSKTVDDVLFAHLRLLKFTLNEKYDNENFENWIRERENLLDAQTKAIQKLNSLGFYFNFSNLETIIK